MTTLPNYWYKEHIIKHMLQLKILKISKSMDILTSVFEIIEEFAKRNDEKKYNEESK